MVTTTPETLTGIKKEALNNDTAFNFWLSNTARNKATANCSGMCSNKNFKVLTMDIQNILS